MTKRYIILALLTTSSILICKTHQEINFPLPLSTYNDQHLNSIFQIWMARIQLNSFNLIAFLIFSGAIIHSFLCNTIMGLAEKIKKNSPHKKGSIIAGILHFCGEIEAVFGLWAIVLALAISFFYDWHTFVYYVGVKLKYTEPMFVVVIMTLASTRPVIKMFELILWKVVKLFGGTLEAWWFTILTIGPLLGSIITGPAAMTISAYLLSDKFYDLNPGKRLKYLTLALLFVNVSVGGVLTSFAAPPVLMVASKWNWNSFFMLSHFGWKSVLGIISVNTLFFFYLKKDIAKLKDVFIKNQFRKYVQRRFINKEELEETLVHFESSINQRLGFIRNLSEKSSQLKEEFFQKAKDALTISEVERYDIKGALGQRFETIQQENLQKTLPGLLPEEERPPFRDPNWDGRDDNVPYWIMVIHAFFMFWTVFNAHEAVLFIGGFLFFLGFFQVTTDFQNRLNLKPALMVGFFLSGLMIHGGVQAWWIAPLLERFSETSLMIGAACLTSFNDNAAITYLSSLVENFSPALKYSVVAGAISGGGLTIIANAPNPAGQSILKRHFKNGISPLQLLKSAMIPTIIILLIFLLL